MTFLQFGKSKHESPVNIFIGVNLNFAYILFIPDCEETVVKEALEPRHRSRLVNLVGKAPVYRAGGSGSIPGQTNTQGLKTIEEKVLPLL